MVTHVNIYQIGSGGTGAWAARALAYGLVNMRNLKPYDIHWHIYDPDIIELKNQIRQPFIGASAIGEHKAVYTMKVIYSILYAYENYKSEEIKVDVTPHLDLIRTPDDIPLFRMYSMAQTVNSAGSVENLFNNDLELFPLENLDILMLCVDNTYTRKIIEDYIDKARPVLYIDYIMKRYPSFFYIDTGNTDKMWVVTAVPMFLAPRIKYDEITLPDPMLSCAARAETTIVPQTTHMNMVSGAYVAKSVLELLNSVDEYYGYVAASIDKDEVQMYRRKEEVIAALNSFSDHRQFERWMLDLPRSSKGITNTDLITEIREYNTRFENRAIEYFTKAESERVALELTQGKNPEQRGLRDSTEQDAAASEVSFATATTPITELPMKGETLTMDEA